MAEIDPEQSPRTNDYAEEKEQVDEELLSSWNGREPGQEKDRVADPAHEKPVDLENRMPGSHRRKREGDSEHLDDGVAGSSFDEVLSAQDACEDLHHEQDDCERKVLVCRTLGRTNPLGSTLQIRGRERLTAAVKWIAGNRLHLAVDIQNQHRPCEEHQDGQEAPQYRCHRRCIGRRRIIGPVVRVAVRLARTVRCGDPGTPEKVGGQGLEIAALGDVPGQGEALGVRWIREHLGVVNLQLLERPNLGVVDPNLSGRSIVPIGV